MPDKVVVFCTDPALGHILPSFCLAKAFRDEGWKAIYATTAEYQSVITAEGFECEVICSKDDVYGLFRTLRRLRVIEASRKAMTLLGRAKTAILARCPLIVFIDVQLQLLISELSSSVIVYGLHTSFTYLRPTLAAPPDCSSLVPSSGRISRFRVAVGWGWAYWKHRSRMLFVLSWLIGPERLTKRNIRRGRLKSYSTYNGVCVDIPAFLLAPQSFDYCPRPGVLYINPGVDLNRSEAPADFRLDARPLILCSFGTNTNYYRGVDTLLRLILELARRKPEWQFIVHSVTDDTLVSTGCPENVTVRSYLPIVSLLKRAALMITHAGLSSIKECIAYNVPMIACPFRWDQYGNAARVMHFGIGRSVAVESLNLDILYRHCEEMMRSDWLGAFVQFRACWDQEVSPKGAVALVERNTLYDSKVQSSHSQQ